MDISEIRSAIARFVWATRRDLKRGGMSDFFIGRFIGFAIGITYNLPDGRKTMNQCHRIHHQLLRPQTRKEPSWFTFDELDRKHSN